MSLRLIGDVSTVPGHQEFEQTLCTPYSCSDRDIFRNTVPLTVWQETTCAKRKPLRLEDY